MSEKRRLVVNTLANGVSQFAAMLASLVFMPLLIGAFGLEDYGLFMLATSVSAYAVLLDLGIGSALTKFVAEHEATGDREALVGSASSALALYTGVGVLGAGLMFAVGALAGAIFDISAEGAQLLRTMLWIGAGFQLWYWPASTARHVLAGLQRFGVLAATGVTSTVLTIAATLFVILGGYGPIILVTLNGFVMVVVSALNVIAARRLSGVPVLGFTGASRLYVRAIFTFSWAVFVVQLSDVLFYQQTDRVLLGIFAGATAVGLYEAAAKFNALLTYVSGLSVSAVMPLASSMGATGRYASLHSLLLRGTKYAAALVCPIVVVLVVFARPLIAAWLGPDFAEQALVAQVLIFPHLLTSLGLVGDAVVISQGKLAGRVPYIVFQAVLNILLSVLLIPRYGVLGVALGTSIAHVVDWPLHMRFLARNTNTTMREALRVVAAPVYPLLVVPLLASIGLSVTALADSIPGILVASAAAVALYWGALAAVGLNPTERAELGRALTAVRARLGGAEGA